MVVFKGWVSKVQRTFPLKFSAVLFAVFFGLFFALVFASFFAFLSCFDSNDSGAGHVP